MEGSSPSNGELNRCLCFVLRHATEIVGSPTLLGPDDNLFVAGGDSLGAVELIAACEEEFGISPSIHALFDTPNLREFAAAIAAML